jgi:D-sedoheptulose 7-phosphate isomerase
MPAISNTPAPWAEPILAYLADSRAALDSLSVEEIEAVIEELQQAYRNGRQVLIIGNGGSAATASHLACDLAKTVLGSPVNRQAQRFRALSLADNMPIITAWANDFSFDAVFAEQIETLGHQDDLLIAITGSGNSPNIVAGVEVARRLGMRSIGLLGFDGGRVKDMVDAHVIVRSNHYGHVEDMHMLLVHLVTAYFSEVVRGARNS